MENHGGTGTTDICSASSGRNYACRLIMHESIGPCKRCPICAHCTSDAHIRERSGAIHACSDQSCARICAPRGRGVRRFRVSKIRLCSLDLFVARSYPGVGKLKVSATERNSVEVIYTVYKLVKGLTCVMSMCNYSKQTKVTVRVAINIMKGSVENEMKAASHPARG